MKSKRNKGFSLVELIVVILIMAILAVALAPQVMKWVKNARIARDRHNYEQMVSVVQEAITWVGVFDEVNSDSAVILTIQDGTNTIVAEDGRDVSDFINAMDSLLPEWKTLNPTQSGSSYWIKIKNGTIEKDPDPNVSDIN